MRRVCGTLRAVGSQRIFLTAAVWLIATRGFSGQEYQTYEQDWALGDPGSELVTFEPFDTLDGARSLTGVSVTFTGDLAFEVAALNFDPVAYSENEWFMDGHLSVLFSFGETPEYPDGGPFFFLGGSRITRLTGDLSPGSGSSPFDPFREPGDVFAVGAAMDTIEATLAIDGEQLDYFLTDTPLQGRLGPFTEFLLDAPSSDAIIEANLIDVSQSGDFTLTYDFDLLCDLDGDDKCGISDIDILTGDLASNRKQDLNADGVTNLEDRDRWLESAAHVNRLDPPYLLGDANLDGSVDASDLNRVGLHWLSSTSRWSEGDFDGTGIVDSADLNTLARQWQMTIDTPAAELAQPVPEPSRISLALCLLLVRVARTCSVRGDRG